MPTPREVQDNAAARLRWLRDGLRGVRPLPAATGGLGTTIRIKLDPVGLMTALIVRVTLRVDLVGIATPGNAAPYCVVARFRLQDSNTNDRILISGDHAYALQCLYSRTGGLGQSGLIYGYPKMPTSTGTDQLVDVSYRLPIVADEFADLRGAMLMPNEPNAYLFVELIPTLLVASDDLALYSATSGTVALNTTTQQPTVEVWQEFIDGPWPLPRLDLRTVHYLQGGQSITSGLGAGNEQLIDYPIFRRVRYLLMSQQVDGLQSLNNAASMRSLIRSNYDAQRMTAVEKFVEQRRNLQGSDLQQGYWYIEHAPEVASAFAREYQAGFTPAVSGTTQSLNFTFDTFGEQAA